MQGALYYVTLLQLSNSSYIPYTSYNFTHRITSPFYAGPKEVKLSEFHCTKQKVNSNYRKLK